MNDTDERVSKAHLSETYDHCVAMLIAGNAHDSDDLHYLLTVLGLLDDPESKGMRHD